jgi:hypothetical protein
MAITSWPKDAGVSRSWPQLRLYPDGQEETYLTSSGAEGPTPWTLAAVFYGRTQIAGLEPGCRVRLRGMVGIGADGRPAMINPAYDLLG